MANQVVTLTSAQGMLLSDVESVVVVEGDTLTIGTQDGSPFSLFFSPDAIAVLSPAPETPFVVPQSTKASFTFTSSKAAAYTAYYGPINSSAPSVYPPEISEQLYFTPIATITVGFSGPGGNDSMTTGR